MCSQLQKTKSLSLLDVYGRVAGALLDAVEEINGIREIDKLLAVRKVGDSLGVASGLVHREIEDFEKDGYITIKDEKIIINEKLPPGW